MNEYFVSKEGSTIIPHWHLTDYKVEHPKRTQADYTQTGAFKINTLSFLIWTL